MVDRASESTASKLLELGQRWYRRGELDEAQTLFEAARLCAQTIGDVEIEAQAWIAFGRASYLFCEPKVAEHAFGRAVECFSRAGDEASVRTATLRESFVAYDAGDLDRSTELLAEATAGTPPPIVAGMAEGYRGNIARSRGDLAAAHERYSNAIAMLRSVDEALYAATFQMDDAIVFLLEANATRAWERLGDARRTARDAPAEPVLTALLAHYEALTATELGDAALLRRTIDGFAAPASVAMDFLSSTHPLLPELLRFSEDERPGLAHRIEVLHTECPPNEHGRLTVRILRGRIGGSRDRDDRLVIDGTERMARLGAGSELRFADGSPEWLILTRLVEHRRTGRGDAVTPQQLIDAGWPGEHASPKSAKNRLHVALSSLRKRGLREILLRHHDGYALSLAVEIVRVRPQSESA